MEKYKEYMEEVKASDKLRAKILHGEKPRRVRVRESVLRFGTAAAGIVAIAMCAFIVATLLGNQEPPEQFAQEQQEYANGIDGYANIGEEPNNLYITEHNENDMQNIPLDERSHIVQDTRQPTLDFVYPLVFNHTNALRFSMNHERSHTRFSTSLREEEILAVLPGFSVNGSVRFCEDGRFAYLHASEYISSEVIFDTSMITSTQFISSGVNFLIAREGKLPDNLLLTTTDGVPIVSYVHGVAVRAFYNPNVLWDSSGLLIAEFTIGDVFYRIEANRIHELYFKEIVNILIKRGGADLSVFDNFDFPPNWTNRLTLEEARAYPVLGAYVPTLPDIFTFAFAHRNQFSRNQISMLWSTSNPRVSVSFSMEISAPWDSSRYRGILATAADYELFDIHQHPPQATWGFEEYMPPSRTRNMFLEPVFRAEELTLDIVRARTRWYDEDFFHSIGMYNRGGGFNPQYRTARFTVLFDDATITISGTGLTAEELWEAVFAPLL